MKNKRIILWVFIVASVLLMLILTSCTKNVDYESFYEKSNEAASDFEARQPWRLGAVVIDGTKYNFSAACDSNGKWTVTYDESLSETQKLSLKATASSLLTTMANDWAISTSGTGDTEYGTYSELEGFKLEKGFWVKRGELYLRFDKHGFLTEYANGGKALMTVEWY